MVTLAPAEAWGFTDRGLLREGLAADINIFDPDRITPTLPVLLHDLPTGAPRLESRADGILATIVGGEITIQRGEHTGAFPGRPRTETRRVEKESVSTCRSRGSPDH